MKRISIIIGALLLTAATANAGLFGAALKPDAKVSPEGINFKIPYLSVELPFPSLRVKAGNTSVEVKLGAVKKKKD